MQHFDRHSTLQRKQPFYRYTIHQSLARSTPALGAFLEGWRRVIAAPAATLCLLAVLAIGGLMRTGDLPAGAWHPGTLRDLAGHARHDWSPQQLAAFHEQLHLLARTFNDHFLRIEGLFPSLVLWLFFAGGVVARLAAGLPIGPERFFSACRACVFPFIRLAIAVFVVYFPLSRLLRPLRFSDVYCVLAVLLMKIVLDFATARLALEDRRSVISAVVAGLRFIRARPFRVASLYGLHVLAYLVILRLWYQAAPSGREPTWVVFLVTLLYLLFRAWSTLSVIASALVFFQGELKIRAHDDMLEPLWPESP